MVVRVQSFSVCALSRARYFMKSVVAREPLRPREYTLGKVPLFHRPSRHEEFLARYMKREKPTGARRPTSVYEKADFRPSEADPSESLQAKWLAHQSRMKTWSRGGRKCTRRVTRIATARIRAMLGACAGDCESSETCSGIVSPIFFWVKLSRPCKPV